MKEKLEKELFEKYPKIFRQKDLPMTQTCMCWGIDCGDGWYKIIDQLCACIQSHVDSNVRQAEYKAKDTDAKVNPLDFQIEAVQVKQKFGGLRFYTNGYDDYVRGAISVASCMSYNTCEECGSTNDIKQTTGWITPLCPKCYRKWQISNLKGRFLSRIRWYSLKHKVRRIRTKMSAYFKTEAKE